MGTELQTIGEYLRACGICERRICVVNRLLIPVEEAASKRRLKISSRAKVDWTRYLALLRAGTGYAPEVIEFLPVDHFMRALYRVRIPQPFFAGPTNLRMLPIWRLTLELEWRHPDDENPREAAGEAFEGIGDACIETVPCPDDEADAALEMVNETIENTLDDTVGALIAAGAIGTPAQQHHLSALFAAFLQNPPVRWKRRGILQVLVA